MSEVERYLDEMFDRLAGTGAAGRRALAETEDHLRAAVAAGLAGGLPEQRAEHEAVLRFGPAALVAGQVRRVHRAGPVRAAVSAAWLVAGVGLSWLGVMFVAAFFFPAGFFPAALRLLHISLYNLCSNFLSPSCYPEMPITWKTLVAGLALLAAGVILLAARRLGRRFFGLAVAGQPVSALAASLFAIAGLALYDSPVVTAGPVPGLRLITIGAAVAAVMAAARNLVQGRRSRWLTQLDSR
jgi:hypothetical protein